MRYVRLNVMLCTVVLMQCNTCYVKKIKKTLKMSQA